MAGSPADRLGRQGASLIPDGTLRDHEQLSCGFHSETSTAGSTMGHSCSQSMQRQYVRTTPGRGRAVYTGNVHCDA